MDHDAKQMLLGSQDKQALTGLLENINMMLKDTDALEEKKFVKDFLQKISGFLQIAVIGSSGAGKSSLLNEMFGGILYAQDQGKTTVGIHEYRYGAEDAEFQPDAYSTRYFRKAAELEGMSVVDTPGIDMAEGTDMAGKIKDVISQSDVLLVVFSSEQIKDFAVWDFIEGADAGRMVFIITKCDLIDEEKQREYKAKIKEYMTEAGIYAPVFCVSSKEYHSGGESGFQEFASYINSHIIGDNPVLTKQRENVSELKGLLARLSSSFELRKKQYEADSKILEKINTSLDSFFASNEELVATLKNDLSREISKEIEAYQDEIIAKLDPKQIWERFKNGSREFMDYLNYIHDGYQKRMTNNVNRKTQAAVRTYLAGLEQVFEEATGYFRTRERLLTLEDKFYGSMAQSKKMMVARADENIKVTTEYYRTLTDASSELFMKVWKARGEYEKKLTFAKAVGGVGGIAAGGGAAYFLAGAAAASATATAAATTGAAATVSGIIAAGLSGGIILWPLVGAALGGLILADISKKIASAKNMPEMEQKVRESVEEFKLEVAGTKEKMTEQILGTVEAIFKRELETTDKTFLDFRMSVNIDSKNIPLLEERMNQIKEYRDKIEELERRSVIE